MAEVELREDSSDGERACVAPLLGVLVKPLRACSSFETWGETGGLARYEALEAAAEQAPVSYMLLVDAAGVAWERGIRCVARVRDASFRG